MMFLISDLGALRKRVRLRLPVKHGTVFSARGLLLLAGFLFSTCSMADCLTSGSLKGVNFAGAAFGSSKIPGTLWKDYMYASTDDIEFFVSRGFNIVRLGIRWERVKRDRNATLDAQNIAELKRLVTYARDRDICLLIDLHNYGKYNGVPLHEIRGGDRMLADFWRELALELGNPEHVALGLMNEPAYVPQAQWFEIVQSVVKQLRKRKITNLVTVAAPGWSGAQTWFKGGSTLFEDYVDPLNRSLIEVHQYTDSNFSGTHLNECRPASEIAGYLTRVGEWGEAHGQRFILGEFAVDASEECLGVLDAMLTAMDASTAWGGWTYWAAGAWWNTSYDFSIHPTDGVMKPQGEVLESHL